MIKTLMENLFTLQKFEFQTETTPPTTQGKIASLRKNIPAPILAHYDRLMAHGKKGVATVRNGVCSECHLSIPRGTVVSLALGNDAHLCDNCNRYLYLPENESILAEPPSPPAKPARRKKATAIAQAV